MGGISASSLCYRYQNSAILHTSNRKLWSEIFCEGNNASIIQRYFRRHINNDFLLLWSAFLGQSYESHQPAFHLQNIINQLEAFCKDWRIGLNPDKTWCLNFYTKKVNNNSPRLWLRGELLKYKKQIKFLGITFDQHLSFETHIDDIVTRCKKG